MATVHVELVSVERLLWSGDATMVIARTTEGELGVLPGHAPLLGELAPGGIVRIQQEGGEELVFAVHGGFLSVTEDGVSVLAELAERSDEIDVGRAQQALERARVGRRGRRRGRRLREPGDVPTPRGRPDRVAAMAVEVVLAVAVAVALVGLVLVVLALRRRVLLRPAGSIDMSLRTRFGRIGGGWALGVGRYTGEDLHWYRLFALTVKPARTLSRRELQVIGRRQPSGAESWAVQAGAVIVECQDDAGPVQVAMSAGAVTGFLSWLESAPPGFAVPGYAAS